MVIRVYVFGPEAAALGASSVDVEVGETPTCQCVLEELKRIHPALTGRIALNHAFVDGDQEVCEDDEVALIGLVSGG